MDDQRQGDGGEDGAARAFAQLGREVSLLRSAIEGLTAAREAIEIPDYQPTLSRTEKALGILIHRIETVAKSPAMTLTPEAMGQRLNAAVESATRELKHQVESSRMVLATTTHDLQGMVVSARRGDQQNWWLLWSWLGGLVLGLLLYAAMAGPIARAAPISWQWPERVAMRVLDEPSLWDAGERLMLAANPKAGARSSLVPTSSATTGKRSERAASPRPR